MEFNSSSRIQLNIEKEELVQAGVSPDIATKETQAVLDE